MLAAQEEVGVERHHNKDSSPLVGQALVVGKEVAVTMGLGCHLNRRSEMAVAGVEEGGEEINKEIIPLSLLQLYTTLCNSFDLKKFLY